MYGARQGRAQVAAGAGATTRFGRDCSSGLMAGVAAWELGMTGIPATIVATEIVMLIAGIFILVN